MQNAKWVKVKEKYNWEESEGYSLRAKTPNGILTYLTFFPSEYYNEIEELKAKAEESKVYVCYVRSRFLSFDTWEGNSVPSSFKTIEEAKEYFYNNLIKYFETQIADWNYELKFLK